MYLLVIAWMYVVLMMSVAEATSSNGTLLGALVTFVLYGLLPVALVVYLMGAPARNKALKKRAAEALQAQPSTPAPAQQSAAGVPPDTDAASLSLEPDAGRHPAGGAESVAASSRVAPVRKEP